MKRLLQLAFMSGCPGFKESNRLPRRPSPTPLSEQQEERARRALHRFPPPPTHTHTLLHQASPGLVGLRMEHDDRQKQSSAPPCAAAIHSARSMKRAAMRHTMGTAIDRLRGREECGRAATRILALFSPKIMSAGNKKK